MRRRIALPAAVFPLVLAVAALALPACAGAAVAGKYFAGTAVDGPSADIQSLSDLDVARDGTGALAYVKQVGGVDHVFVSRLADGTFQAPDQIDAGLAGAGSQPVVAASDGGRLVVAFVNGGSLYSIVRPAGDGYGSLQQVAVSGSNPDVDMSINGVAYLTWTSNGDVQAARLERNATTFNPVPGPLDINPAATAGTGAGRSRVAVAADGIATVVWGEGGHVYGRRIFELRLSTAPQDLGDNADSPDISSEDDSSFAWAVFRQNGVAVARRLVGSQFDPPVTLEGAEAAELPQVAINGRGVGYAGIDGVASGAAYGAVLKDDIFNAGVVIGGGFGITSAPVPAVAESGDGLIAYQQGDAAGNTTVHARAYDYVPASRTVTPPGPDATLSSPALGSVDAARGLLASADRAGDVVVAFVQGSGANSQLMAASFDRAPGAFNANTTTKWRNFSKTPLKWGTSFELWGPLTYRVLVDNVQVAQTSSTSVTVPTPIKDGLHRWRVVAVDRRGQTRSTKSRNMRADATPPHVTFKVSGARKRGGLVKVAAQVTDASTSGAKASGLKDVKISFGDGSRAIAGRRAAHRYGRSGHVTVSVTARDNADNVFVGKRRITIRK
jgi:hypothetical protein